MKDEVMEAIFTDTAAPIMFVFVCVTTDDKKRLTLPSNPLMVVSRPPRLLQGYIIIIYEKFR